MKQFIKQTINKILIESIIEDFLKSIDMSSLINEASSTKVSIGGNSQGVDDGPGFTYGNSKTYKKIGDDVAEALGWEVVDYILGTDEDSIYADDARGIEDKYPVSYFPSGVDGLDAQSQRYMDFKGNEAYKIWADHIRNVATAVGYKLIDFLDAENGIEDTKEAPTKETSPKQKLKEGKFPGRKGDFIKFRDEYFDIKKTAGSTAYVKFPHTAAHAFSQVWDSEVKLSNEKHRGKRVWVMEHKLKINEGLITEFDYGKVLFGEPSDDEYFGYFDDSLIHQLGWKKIVPNWGEENTADEKRALSLLRKWFEDSEATSELSKVLNKLKKLKKKFPKILDPKVGMSLVDGNTFYRGTLLSVSELSKLSGWHKTRNKSTLSTLRDNSIETSSPYVWKPKSSKGFTSVTPNIEVAYNFAMTYSSGHLTTFFDDLVDNKGDVMNKKFPVILAFKYTNPSAILSPVFTNALSTYRESEVFLVGNSIKVDKIYIPGFISKINKIQRYDKNSLAYIRAKKMIKHAIKLFNGLTPDEFKSTK